MSAKITLPIPEWLDRVCVWPVLVYRRHKKGWPYRRIYLGQGKWTIVEPGDYYWLNEYNWYLGGNGKEFYAYTNIVTGPGKTRMTTMHRLIMNPPANLLIDHHNNTTLDNRRDNLRLATHSQNACNRPKIKGTSSQYIGVYYEKTTGRWTAKIRVDDAGRKRLWLGRFVTEEEAGRAYDRAAIKYHSQFAKLNFPIEDYINEFPRENPK